ncbi:MAG: hypothetical protein JW780_06925 [Clostridiales bacterium]|nr:hypothetical protein [Clostridiales bacterium]
MSMNQGIALSCIVLAGMLLFLQKMFAVKLDDRLKRFMSLSGIVYLSVTLVLYFLIRFNPSLPLTYTILSESVAFGVHILNVSLMIIFYRLLSNYGDKRKDKKGGSDVEPE